MKTITTHAPGYLVLMGEHALLHGQPGIVAATDAHITVALTPRADNHINIESTIGSYRTTLQTLTIEPPFQFVLGALLHYKTELATGADISITSNLPNAQGFGSSTAVTVAMTKALHTWLTLSDTFEALFDTAQTITHAVQGVGSGADIATSIVGGIVYFCDDGTRTVEPLPCQNFPGIHSYYCGYKTPTAEVLKKLAPLEKANPTHYATLYTQMGTEVGTAKTAIEAQDWQALGQSFNRYQDLLKALGVSDNTLGNMCDTLQNTPNVLGAKISGAGLGDCVIALGNPDHNVLPEYEHADLRKHPKKPTATSK
jgi:mevalonate kinase